MNELGSCPCCSKTLLDTTVSLEDVRLCLKWKANKAKRRAEAVIDDNILSPIKWKSDKIKKIWKPRILRIVKAWEKIEILSVSDGLRDCCWKISMYNHELLSLADQHPELSIFLTKSALRPFTRSIVHEATILRRSNDIQYEKINLRNLPLGYPSCCINNHNALLPEGYVSAAYEYGQGCSENGSGAVWNAASNTTQSDINNDLINIECPFETNFLLRDPNMKLVAMPHIPCNFNCKETISHGIKFVMRGESMDLEKKWIGLKKFYYCLWSGVYSMELKQ